MLSTRARRALGAALAVAGVAATATSAQAATITVNSTADKGSGTLRDAINAANGTPAVADTIRFRIPGSGVRTITLASPLPVISSRLTIDGYTQNGAAPATDSAAAQLKMVLDANGQSEGLEITADDVTVRGLDIQDALRDGVLVEGARDLVAGNHIGTNAAGTAARPDWVGVTLDGEDDTVGGPDPADRNVISGNSNTDVLLDSGSGHLVQGNRIGTTADGLSALSDGDGVYIEQADGSDVRDNLVSGENVGIVVAADDNTVQHNDVGTDATGAGAVANNFGILVGGDGNQVGGTGADDGNVVSGNTFEGVKLGYAATDNDVQGNLIGLTATEDAALPNGTGVEVFGTGSTGNTIGGSADGAGNAIAGNTGDGVRLDGGASATAVRGNAIGTDRAGTLALGNGRSGVAIADSDDNEVGGTSAGGANTIAYNGDDGVTVTSSDGGVSGVGNAVVRNSIHDNGDGIHPKEDLGIDLAADGGTPNDYFALDADVGANRLQNDPDIDSASVASGVDWSLDSGSSRRYRLDFYASPTCDASGSGEGETFLGSDTVNTNVNGLADGTFTPTTPLTAGEQVTVTATEIVAGALRSTSEFSPCETAS